MAQEPLHLTTTLRPIVKYMDTEDFSSSTINKY